MPENLGPFLVEVLLLLIGVFLMLAAYSRKPLLLRIVTLGTLHIDPDSPGRRQRAIIFGVGVGLILVAVVLIVVDKLQTARAA